MKIWKEWMEDRFWTNVRFFTESRVVELSW